MGTRISRAPYALLRKTPHNIGQEHGVLQESPNDLKKVDDEEDDGNGEKDNKSYVDNDDEPVAGWDIIVKAADATAPKMTVKNYVCETLLKEGELPDADDERDTRRRYVAEEKEVAYSKPTLNDNGENERRTLYLGKSLFE